MEMSRAQRAHLAAAALYGLPATAWPHAFDERYDLPAPLSYFIIGAAAAVGLSFVAAAWFARSAPSADTAPGWRVSLGPLLPLLRAACGGVSLTLFALTIVAGLFGTRDPMMNLAPTMVWIVVWIGLSLVCACIGNLWPVLDPWRRLYGLADALVRGLGRDRGLALGWNYPAAIGAWPAVALLLALAWFEVVYAQAALPHRLAWALLGWSALSLAGTACFGREAWQENADVFAVYFATLGRFAPIAAGGDGRSLLLRAPGRGLVTAAAGSAAKVAFVVAMLSTVLFDGLTGGEAWQLIQGRLARAAPFAADGSGYVIGTGGLVGVWLVFLAAYWLTCAITAAIARERRCGPIARAFAPTLVPIAIAYNIAHNCSYLVLQGQRLIPLLSDPLGLKWNLFGGAGFRPDLGLVDARLSWYVAIAAIVAGHAVALWLAHRVALSRFRGRRHALIACLPLTALMLAYTAISLAVIAEPMVKFEAIGATSCSTPARCDRLALRRGLQPPAPVSTIGWDSIHRLSMV
jgi:hypothetical protein